MLTFAERALPLLRLGLHVIPLKPYLPGQSPDDKRPKEAYWTDYQNMAQATEEDILKWNETNPNDNVGCLAKRETVWMLDVDTPELILEIERDCKQKMPETMIVRSGRTTTWAAHYYYEQDDESRKMTNGAIKDRGQWQIHNRYVVGPGSIHPSGKEYASNGKPIMRAPKWLIDYLISRAEKPKPRLAVKFEGDAKAGEQRTYVDKFLADNKWEIRGEWRDYVSPGGQVGFKIFVKCSNESEHTPGEGNDSSSAILVADGLGLDFKCQHHHCLHLTWEDFRAVVEVLPDLSSWGKRAPVPETSATEVPPTVDAVELYSESTYAPVIVPEAPNVVNAAVDDEETPWPMEVMECRLGRIALSLGCPPAWAFISTLVVWSGRGVTHIGPPIDTMTSLYGALLARPHQGKTRTSKRARHVINYPGVVKQPLASENALIMALGGRKLSEFATEEDKIPRPYLLIQDEGSALLSKTRIKNSALPEAINTLFNETEFEKKVDKHVLACYPKLSVLMGLTCETPGAFAALFGRETVAGLYDRFLYADGPRGWKFDNNWIPDLVELNPLLPIATGKQVLAMVEEWMNVDRDERGRLGELAIRIAILICSGEEREPDTHARPYSSIPGVVGDLTPCIGVTERDMRYALRVMDYVMAVRRRYQPGRAEDSFDARCHEAIMRELERYPAETPTQFSKLYKKLHLEQFGAVVVNRTLMALKLTKQIDIVEEDVGGRYTRKWVQRIGEV